MSDDGGQRWFSSIMTTMSLHSNVNLYGLALELIFEELANEPETLVNCTRVTNIWDQLLWERKPRFMLHLVLPMLAKHLDFQDLMHCRVVCRNWKCAVNSRLDEEKEAQEEWSCHNIVRERGFSNGWSRFDLTRNPEEFVNCFIGNQAENHFPTGTVLYRNFYPASLASNAGAVDLAREMMHPNFNNFPLVHKAFQFDTNFQRMLQVFGTHVSHLVYSIESRNYQSEFVTERNDLSPRYVAKMLKLLPNISRLTLLDVRSRCTTYFTGRAPPLPNLVELTLRFSCNRAVPTTISHFLFTSYGSQIHDLECSAEDLLLPQPFNRPFAFPKLRKLKLRSPLSYEEHEEQQRPTNSWGGRDDFIRRFNSSLIAPSLEKLYVELLHLRSDEDNHWNLLYFMAGIQCLSSSIRQLDVRFIGGPNNSRHQFPLAAKPFVHLSKILGRPLKKFVRLTTFRITSLNSPITLQFSFILIKMPALEELRAIRDDGDKLKESEVAHLFTLPSLEKLYIGKLEWTSEEYPNPIRSWGSKIKFFRS